MKVKLKVMNLNKASKSWFSNCGALSDTADKCTENAQKQGATEKVLRKGGGLVDTYPLYQLWCIHFNNHMYFFLHLKHLLFLALCMDMLAKLCYQSHLYCILNCIHVHA